MRKNIQTFCFCQMEIFNVLISNKISCEKKNYFIDKNYLK